MLLLPAIDLLEGRCVRLQRGDFDSSMTYSDDPVATAVAFETAGARALHVVDLSGARAGSPRQAEQIAEITRAVRIPVQAGGGLRSASDVEGLLAAGVHRVLLGTAALRDSNWTGEMVRRFGGGRLAVAVDVRGERVALSGWKDELPVTLKEVLDELAGAGVQNLLVTDVERDGTLAGPNLDLYQRFASAPFRIAAAGGIASLAHVRELEAVGIAAAVVGRAVYEGMLTLEELRAFSCS